MFRELFTESNVSKDYSEDAWLECLETASEYSNVEANKIVKKMEKDGWKCWKQKYVPKYYLIKIQSPFSLEDTQKKFSKYSDKKLYYCSDDIVVPK